jgi:fluoride exporter
MAPPDPSLPLDPDLDPTSPRLRLAVLVAVFVGGCVGGLVRYAVVRGWPVHGYDVPWSTLTVNVGGSFVLALVVVAVSRRRLHSLTRPLLGAGFCGALTTFSSFVVAVDEMWAHDHVIDAIAYLLVTVVASLGAAVAGYLVATRMLPVRAA